MFNYLLVHTYSRHSVSVGYSGNDPFSIWFYGIMLLAFLGIVGYVGYHAWRKIKGERQNEQRLAKVGSLGTARVVSAAKTGLVVNELHEMRLVLDVTATNLSHRQVQVEQLIDIALMPQAGDQVYVLIDPTNPDNVVLAPVPLPENLKKQRFRLSKLV